MKMKKKGSDIQVWEGELRAARSISYLSVYRGEPLRQKPLGILSPSLLSGSFGSPASFPFSATHPPLPSNTSPTFHLHSPPPKGRPKSFKLIYFFHLLHIFFFTFRAFHFLVELIDTNSESLTRLASPCFTSPHLTSL